MELYFLVLSIRFTVFTLIFIIHLRSPQAISILLELLLFIKATTQPVFIIVAI